MVNLVLTNDFSNFPNQEEDACLEWMSSEPVVGFLQLPMRFPSVEIRYSRWYHRTLNNTQCIWQDVLKHQLWIITCSLKQQSNMSPFTLGLGEEFAINPLELWHWSVHFSTHSSLGVICLATGMANCKHSRSKVPFSVVMCPQQTAKTAPDVCSGKGSKCA